MLLAAAALAGLTGCSSGQATYYKPKEATWQANDSARLTLNVPEAGRYSLAMEIWATQDYEWENVWTELQLPEYTGHPRVQLNYPLRAPDGQFLRNGWTTVDPETRKWYSGEWIHSPLGNRYTYRRFAPARLSGLNLKEGALPVSLTQIMRDDALKGVYKVGLVLKKEE